MPPSTSLVHYFLYVPTEQRFREYFDQRGSNTDALSVETIGYRRYLAVVSFDGQSIDGVGVLDARLPAATAKRKTRLTDLVEAAAPVPLSRLQAYLTNEQYEQVTAAMQSYSGGEELPGKTAKALRDALIALDAHELVAAWERTEAALGVSDDLWDVQHGEPVVAYERDAVGLALDLGGIDRRQLLRGWSGSDSAPFLQGLTEFKVLEDNAIVNDAGVFGDWDVIRRDLVGVAEFSNRGRKLTVLNANRTSVEKALGCDLVYYVHEYDSYVLVQYKRLKKSSPGESSWKFWPASDKNFEKELERMRDIAAPVAPKPTPANHRLGDNFCFVKFCKSKTDKPLDGGLAKGMYVPLDYYDLMVQSGALKGKKGGDVVSYDTVGRWLTNSLFVKLVERSWVGTRGVTGKQITQVIKNSLDANHSLVLASGHAPGAGERGA